MLNSSTTASSSSAHFGLVARGRLCAPGGLLQELLPELEVPLQAGRGYWRVNKLLPAGGDRPLWLAS